MLGSIARMFGTQHYSLFLLSGILLNITPGQDTLYILGRSIAQGRRAGLLSVFGIGSGAVIHTLAAAFGLSAILATSASAFTVVKLVGAAYLVYLGIRMWLERSASFQSPADFAQARSWSIYRAGLLTNLFNPKVALFYLAFLPQFVNPLAHSKLVAFLFLGASFLATGTIWCVFLALTASTIGSRLRTSTSASTIIRRATGTLFVGLGVRLAVTK
jgi:threonine/homoserine/homoserine lactone efflux protein